jgi:glycerate 2-kinase
MRFREDADRILRAAVAAADPGAAVRAMLRRDGDTLRVGEAAPFDLRRGRLWIVGAGKATPRMAEAALAVLGSEVAGGVVTTKHRHALPLERLAVWEAGHPLPDSHSLAAAAETLRLVRGASADDLVLCLLSGGASSLWAAPPPQITLTELRRTIDALLRSGAAIGETNVVRRHLSRLAGGRLAAATPARVATLALSDVIGSEPAAIGSGPTVGDASSFGDALDVLRRCRVDTPPAVRAYLQAGAAGEVEDTLAPGDPRLERASFHIVADLRAALDGARAEAERLGYSARIVSDRLEGEARDVGEAVAAAALQAGAQHGDGAPAALLWGGETTVTVQGDGRGGRNQELALAAALRLEAADGVQAVVAACGTDGTDGPTDAAGAIVDAGTVPRARAAGLDAREHLARNDAYPLLQAAGDLLVTGPTGTNVNDLVVALVG